jgi:nicotinamide-nucleotide amidase
MVLDEALEARIGMIVERALRRWQDVDPDALRAANRKQAVIPTGSTVLAPRGTAPGLVVPPVSGTDGPTVVVLPGPPGELQPMWKDASASEAFQHAITGATVYRHEILRLYGMPEAEIANTLREADAAGVQLAPLEITTCLRRGEIEVLTRFEPAAQAQYDALLQFIVNRHGDKLFSRDGTTIDDQVASLLLGAGETIAAAESCTGGLLAARLTERPGSSAYMVGGVVAYGNAAKSDLVGVDPGLIAARGAVSVEVARALADGARLGFHASVGVGITGVAGPGGGTPDKPVGLVCFSVVWAPPGSDDAVRVLTRSANLPGDRGAVRDRATTVAMHLIALVLGGESD